jgi:peptidoglycan-associated lipoprotein
MKKIILSALLLSLLGACSSQSTKIVAIDTPNTSQKEESVSINPLNDPNNILSKRSIYFEYDRYDIKSEYMDLIDAHANYLQKNSKVKITIQGNADDRGSHEYNLALGQRRAVALKKVLNLKGVSDTQIETVSFGEEKPKAEGHNEQSWSQNRRDDIVYQDE